MYVCRLMVLLILLFIDINYSTYRPCALAVFIPTWKGSIFFFYFNYT